LLARPRQWQRLPQVSLAEALVKQSRFSPVQVASVPALSFSIKLEYPPPGEMEQGRDFALRSDQPFTPVSVCPGATLERMWIDKDRRARCRHQPLTCTTCGSSPHKLRRAFVQNLSAFRRAHIRRSCARSSRHNHWQRDHNGAHKPKDMALCPELLSHRNLFQPATWKRSCTKHACAYVT